MVFSPTRDAAAHPYPVAQTHLSAQQTSSSAHRPLPSFSHPSRPPGAATALSKVVTAATPTSFLRSASHCVMGTSSFAIARAALGMRKSRHSSAFSFKTSSWFCPMASISCERDGSGARTRPGQWRRHLNSGKQMLLLCCMPAMCTETHENTTNSAFRLLLETLCPFSTQLPGQQREQGPAAAHAASAVSTTVSCAGLSNVPGDVCSALHYLCPTGCKLRRASSPIRTSCAFT